MLQQSIKVSLIAVSVEQLSSIKRMLIYECRCNERLKWTPEAARRIFVYSESECMCDAFYYDLIEKRQPPWDINSDWMAPPALSHSLLAYYSPPNLSVCAATRICVHQDGYEPRTTLHSLTTQKPRLLSEGVACSRAIAHIPANASGSRIVFANLPGIHAASVSHLMKRL